MRRKNLKDANDFVRFLLTAEAQTILKETASHRCGRHKVAHQPLLGSASHDPLPFAGKQRVCFLRFLPRSSRSHRNSAHLSSGTYVSGLAFTPRACGEVCLMCHSKARSGP
jgi:hypothetical protein